MAAVEVAVAYRLEDRFATDRSAGTINGTAAEPGPGTRTVVDSGSRLAIASGALTCASGASSWGDPGLYHSSQPRAGGRAFLASFLTTVANTAIGWHGAASGRVNYQALYFSGGAALVHQPSDQTIGGYSAATTYTVAFIQRAAGAFFLISGGAFTTYPTMTLLWVDAFQNATPLYPAWSNFNSAVTTDDWRVVDLGAPWDTTFGAATSATTTPTSGATGTMTADGLVEFTWTAATGETLDLAVRSTDSNNRWIARCDQAGSTIRLYEKNGGTETQRATAAQTWTNGTAYRILVRCVGSALTTWVGTADNNYTQKNNYASASFNNTATGIAASGFATGANFVAWPRTVTINEAEGQPTALRHSLLRTGARRWGRGL
jgi:hypothetical protein